MNELEWLSRTCRITVPALGRWMSTVYVLRSGCRWRDCPPEYGPWTTIYKRWSAQGLWRKVFERLAAAGNIPDELGIDSTNQGSPLYDWPQEAGFGRPPMPDPFGRQRFQLARHPTASAKIGADSGRLVSIEARCLA